MPHRARALPSLSQQTKGYKPTGWPSQLCPPAAGLPLSCPRPGYVASEENRILLLTELLERKAHSPFYQEGVSNALLKMAELGLTRAADVLLQNGANLHFEGQLEPRGAGGLGGLSMALLWVRVARPSELLLFS